MMGRVLKAVGIDEDPLLLIIYFMGEGVDPNVNSFIPGMSEAILHPCSRPRPV